ncbi:hypothetical protein MAMC_00183 [Methylacidimicrobium cyclopophantes]|uniref:Uncharacterized protein n=1 Tax=Methylacidimicrobium cyclopophantes TaxID=1041766 RepID=A0A5E6M5R1_9BACT|nr:hypothetical protein [Methylacidimicrobium cyclopophantes]VVM04685.1 hypothetical protein MAMC_00183 [Methylacidimicrobium cyclopophantes]
MRIGKSILCGALLLCAGIVGLRAEEKQEVTVKGELVDLYCYIDHGAAGDKHSSCARKCINLGLPVGLKGDDGKLYMLFGEHKPLKSSAIPKTQTVTVKGKLASAEGYNLIEDAEFQP